MIMLDTSKVDEVTRYMNAGILRGVTTNPTILKRDGAVDNLLALYAEIANKVKPFPVSVEVTTNDTKLMLKEARGLSKIASNIVVKIPICGPEGEENLHIVNILETEHKVRINVTAIMSAQQGLLAVLAGASYVSLFGGRINNMGYNCIEEIQKLRGLIDIMFGGSDPDIVPKIIVGSVRESLNVVEWLLAGADFVTVPPSILKPMDVHPYTKETVKMFLEDAKKL